VVVAAGAARAAAVVAVDAIVGEQPPHSTGTRPRVHDGRGVLR
jgi:hypothetical protein